MNCFKCEKDLPKVFKDSDIRQPNDGLTFTATGNYGSTVYDPTHRAPKLVIWICDECVVGHKQFVQVVSVREQISRDEHWEDFDPDKEYY